MASSEEKDMQMVVTDKDLQDLSGELTKEWLDLARNLKIPDSKTYAIKRDNRDNEKETMYQTLLFWKRREGQNATYEVLDKALSEVDRNDLSNKIRTPEIRKKKSISSPRPIDDTVPDEVLKKLYRKVGNDWKPIGICLKLEEYDLDHLSSDNVGNQAEKSRQMFRKWKQKNGKNATYRRLKDAFTESDRTDLVDELEALQGAN